MKNGIKPEWARKPIKSGQMRLCEWCLKSGKRCGDSRRWQNLQRCWKRFRKTRWKSI